MARLGHEVTVYCKSENPRTAPREYKGVKLVHFPKFRRQFADYGYHAIITTAHASVSDVDVLHFFGCDHVPFALTGRLAGKSVVMTLDGLEWRRMGYPFTYKAYLRSFAELAMVFPHAVAADSLSSQRWYAERTGVSPDFIPYGWTASSSYDPEVLRKYGLEPGKYIVFVGRLVYEKGAHTLIEGFRSVKGDIKLVVIGGALSPGSYVENLKKGADDRVVFLGYVHGSEFESLRNAALIYVHPSLFDGYSISLVGAIASGKSVLSSNLRENVDLAGEGASYFEKDNSDDLGMQLQKLLDSPGLREELAARALTRARQLPTWDDVTAMYEKLYLKATARK